MKNINESKKKSRKQRETELRKQIILDAAETLFRTNGYENTTMDQIATQSEFSKGTLYNYFASKDELYLAIATKAYDLIIKYTKELTEKEEPGIEQLKAIGYAYYAFLKEYPKYAHIFHDIAIKVPSVNKKPENGLSSVEVEYLKKSNTYGKIFVSIITKAIESKQIRSDKNPLLIGIALSSLTNGLMKEIAQHQDNLQNYNVNSDEIVDFVFEMIGEGLKPRN
jgi:AcrR family transcriptional regulator